MGPFDRVEKTEYTCPKCGNGMEKVTRPVNIGLFHCPECGEEFGEGYLNGRKDAKSQAENIREVIQEITDWKDKAYPLSVFPEPDLKRAHELLKSGGMTIDAISASNIRFTLKIICEMLSAALSKADPE